MVGELALNEYASRRRSAGHGRWAITEFTTVYEIEAEFNKLIAAQCESLPADVVDHEV